MNGAMILLAHKASPKITRSIGRTGLKLKKQSPHILFSAGLVGTVASTVLACRSTLKLSSTLDEIQAEISEVKNDGSKVRPNEESGKDLVYVYIKSAAKLGRLYAPSIGIGLVSVGCLTRSHFDLTRRNTQLMAAYATLQTAYDSYRSRVRAELGDDRELDLYNGVVEVHEAKDGTVKKILDTNGLSPYARFFDEYSIHWEKDAEINRLYVQCQQNYANELLRARGHLFLNEVYDMLGIERSQPGAVVGWVIGGGGDDYVDFGMFDPANSPFINGTERSVLLDFNVDGVIYDKI